MIRKLSKKDEHAVLAFLNQEPEINLYIIGDIKNVGFDNENQCIYAEFRNGDYYAVMSRNHSHITYYAIEPDFNNEWLAIFERYDYLFISGKSKLMQPITSYLKNVTPDRLEFMKSTTFEKDPSIDYTGVITLDNPNEASQIYDFLVQINELDSVKMKTKEEFIQFMMENSGDNGTTVFYKQDGHVVASASAVNETDKTAMIVGVATHPDYRQQGFGQKVFHFLVDLYINNKHKTLCLYYDDPRAGALYEKLGFEIIEDWTMLIKDVE